MPFGTERRRSPPSYNIHLISKADFVDLKLLHGNNVGRLDVVLEFLDLILEGVEGDLLVLDDKVDLKLADTVTNGNKLGTTPDETVLLDRANALLKGLHVSLVICRRITVSNYPFTNLPEAEKGRRSFQAFRNQADDNACIEITYPKA